MKHKPELFAYTKRATYEAAKTGGPAPTPSAFAVAGANQLSHSAAHWGSVYKNEVEQNSKLAPIKSERPIWSLPREAYSSKRSYFKSEYQNSLGTFGHNPRDELPSDSQKQSHKVHDLTMGTTQTTCHIPGYNGFIPKSDFNAKAAEQAKLADKSRATIVKQNIVENYQVKLPGYSGHKPMSTVNDRGACRPNCLNMEGEAF